jgi:hypothetical protein
MQTQQRAENGVKEIIVGYIGHPPLMPDEDANDLGEVIDAATSAFAGDIRETPLEELPADVRAILLAEKHRNKTGEVVSSDKFMPQREVAF